MNDRITPGPAIPAPWPMTTKMPVPMMAPTPIAVSWVALTARFSWCPDSSVSVTRSRTSRIANTPGLPLSRTAIVTTSGVDALTPWRRGSHHRHGDSGQYEAVPGEPPAGEAGHRAGDEEP